MLWNAQRSKLKMTPAGNPQEWVQPRWHAWWPAGPRSQLAQRTLMFYCRYWCLSSCRGVSCRRDPSKCHQVLFFFWSKRMGDLRPTFMYNLFDFVRTPFSASTTWDRNIVQAVLLLRRPMVDRIDRQTEQILICSWLNTEDSWLSFPDLGIWEQIPYFSVKSWKDKILTVYSEGSQ